MFKIGTNTVNKIFLY